MRYQGHGTRINRLSRLFVERAATLPARSLRILEAALEDRQADARQIAEALVSAVSEREADGVALSGKGIGELVSRDVGLAALDAITVDDDSTDWAQSELLGVGDAAERLGVARTTLDNWRTRHKALAFPKGLRNYVFPMAQFDGAKPIPGLDKVRAHFRDDEDAWEWLVAYNRLTGETMPIEWLREGHVDEVVRAAVGALDYA